MAVIPKILVAEDDELAAQSLIRILGMMGFEVAGAVRSGEDVIDYVELCRPDIVLMDISLDGAIDGIHAAENIHSHYDIPVIYLTAHSDGSIFERAKHTDPYAYLIKPYDIHQLQKAIEIALFKHSLESRLRESENRYRTIFEVSDNAMMLFDERSDIIMVNEQFEKMTGYSKSDVEGRKKWTDFFEQDEQSILEQRIYLQQNAEKGALHNFESKLVVRSGNFINVFMNIKRIPDTDTYIVSMNDISELKQAERSIRLLNEELNVINQGLQKEIICREKIEKQLRYKATHDHLTGLPNRVLLFDRIKQAFAFEKRHNTLITLMVLDLDNFKNINDTLGHMAGDNILKKVASRLQNCIRQYDTVGRLGGDEFVLLINDACTIQDIVTFAEKVLSVFIEPFDVLGQQTFVTPSIGIAVYPLHGNTIEALLRKADLAMYVAKKAGRNIFRFFSDSMDMPESAMKDMRTVRRMSQMEKISHDAFKSVADSVSLKERLAH